MTAALACAEPSSPTGEQRSTDGRQRNPIIIIGGHPIVLNAQLRSTAPDWSQLLPVQGHLQLKIYDAGEAGLLLQWQGNILDPECDASSSFGGGIYAIQDSEDFPSPVDVAFVELRTVRGDQACSVVEGVIAISGEAATRLVTDPEDFVAAFFLSGGAIGGTLQLGGPDTAPTR